MSAAPDYSPGWAGESAADLAGLLAGAKAAVSQLVGGADLAALDDGQAAAVMGALTTLVAQLDGLRAGVAAVVRDRELYGRRGARNLVGWLRADARVADDAWKLARLAAAAPRLPKVTGLLDAGEVSLAQAATACWQIAQLPETVRRPEEADPSAPSGPAGIPVAGEPEPGGDPRWAGLWRAGDVHAAADELFSSVLPRLDGAGLRQLGAHLREAADAQERAGEEYQDFARRGLRISRSLGGCGEITGRLHAEAAEQVIAAFDELGAKTGPDDARTKAQRWADVLTRLAATATGTPLPPPDVGPQHQLAAASGSQHRFAPPTATSEPEDDQPWPADGGDGTGHHHASSPADAHRGARHEPTAGAGARPSGDAGPLPAGYQRPRLIVTVPLATLLGQPLAPGATMLGSGTPLTSEAARRLACDAEIVRFVTGPQYIRPGDTQPGVGSGTATQRLLARLAAGIAQLPPPLAGPSAALDIGRKSPGWTPRQRDALAAQYGGRCGHPGCTGPIDVVHHLVHWADGGPTSIANGFPCCLYHHWLIHEGGWRIKKHLDGTITTIPPPPGWRPGTIYRHGQPTHEHTGPRPHPRE